MKTFRILALLPAIAAIGSGCVSVNVGKPETFSKEFYGGEQPVEVLSEKCLKAEPTVDSRQLAKGRVGIGLRGDIETKTGFEKVYKTLTIERQKKLDFGFCPGWHEALDLGTKKGESDNMIAMVGCNFDGDSKVYENRIGHGFSSTMGFLLGIYLMVPYATFVEPFAGDYSCSTHHWILPKTPVRASGFIQYFADEAGDRKTAMEIISSPEFEPLGVKTHASPGSPSQSAFASMFTHMALFGFHKWSRVRVLPIEITRREPLDKVETKVENKMAVGPFRVRLSIPSLGYEESVDVPKGRSQAWFDGVPDGAGAGTEVGIAFEAPETGTVPVTSALLEAVGAEQHSLTL